MAANGSVISASAQDYLEIFDITRDLVILKDGGAAVVLQVNAINFGLLSEPEQDAIIYAYAALINSLTYPIQITIKSQPKDATAYLSYIDEQIGLAKDQIRQQQIKEYRQFVGNLIREQHVLDKRFYVTILASALEMGIAEATNPVTGLLPGKKPEVKIDRAYIYEKAQNILVPRRDHLMSQFGRIGLVAKPMGTKDLISLFYTIYNGEDSEGVQVVDDQQYRSPVIQADAVKVPEGLSPTVQQSSPPAAPEVITQPVPTTPPPANAVAASMPQDVAPPPLPSSPTPDQAAPGLIPTPANTSSGASGLVLDETINLGALSSIPTEGPR